MIINGDRYTPPVLSFDSFTVEIAGLYMLFDAPSIGLQVRYLPVDLHYFKVELPKVIYYNNTEGLCGKLPADIKIIQFNSVTVYKIYSYHVFLFFPIFVNIAFNFP